MCLEGLHHIIDSWLKLQLSRAYSGRSVGSGLRNNNRHSIYMLWPKWIIRPFIKLQYLRDFSEKKLGPDTRLLPEPLEKSRNKIGLRTQMKNKILSMYSEEATLQSHVSFCRLTQVWKRYRQKTKAWRGEIWARRLLRAAIGAQPVNSRDGVVYRLGTRANGFTTAWTIKWRWSGQCQSDPAALWTTG